QFIQAVARFLDTEANLARVGIGLLHQLLQAVPCCRSSVLAISFESGEKSLAPRAIGKGAWLATGIIPVGVAAPARLLQVGVTGEAAVLGKLRPRRLGPLDFLRTVVEQLQRGLGSRHLTDGPKFGLELRPSCLSLFRFIPVTRQVGAEHRCFKGQTRMT